MSRRHWPQRPLRLPHEVDARGGSHAVALAYQSKKSSESSNRPRLRRRLLPRLGLGRIDTVVITEIADYH